MLESFGADVESSLLYGSAPKSQSPEPCPVEKTARGASQAERHFTSLCPHCEAWLPQSATAQSTLDQDTLGGWSVTAAHKGKSESTLIVTYMEQGLGA